MRKHHLLQPRVVPLAGLLALLAFLLVGWPRPAFADVGYGSQSTASTSGNTTSLTINRPASTAAGDLLLATIATDGNPTISAPAGWTQIDQGPAAGNAARLAVFYRIAGASEPASYMAEAIRATTSRSRVPGLMAASPACAPMSTISAAFLSNTISSGPFMARASSIALNVGTIWTRGSDREISR